MSENGSLVRWLWIRRGIVFLSILAPFVFFLSSGYWLSLMASSLVSDVEPSPSEAIVIENLEENYLLFERTERLVRNGFADRVIVSGRAYSAADLRISAISDGFIDVMVRVSRVGEVEKVPIFEEEPIAYNAALQIRDYLEQQQIRSVIIVASGFRSQRTYLIYSGVLSQSGIRVSCEPVFGLKTPENFSESWHGLQVVALEFLKLQYYKWAVL